MNSTTRYSPEAPAEGLYQVGLFTSALSHLYHGYLKKKRTPPDPYLDNYYNYHIDFEMVMSHFRVYSVMILFFLVLDLNKVCVWVGGGTYFPTPLQLKTCQWLPVKFRGLGPYLGLLGASPWSTLVPLSQPTPHIHSSPSLTYA